MAEKLYKPMTDHGHDVLMVTFVIYIYGKPYELLMQNQSKKVVCLYIIIFNLIQVKSISGNPNMKLKIIWGV